jgi:hypothetical protein
VTFRPRASRAHPPRQYAYGERRVDRHALPGSKVIVPCHVMPVSSPWVRREQAEARRLRDFCGTLSCFVVLSCALGSICNGHPASEVVKYQLLVITKFPISAVPLATNQEAGSSNLSGRTIAFRV